MKVNSVSVHHTNKTYAVEFNDGITVILNDKLCYHSMLSLGLDSVYLKTGKWPTDNNIQKRVDAGRAWIEKNKNRYKKFKVAVDDD
jgi:hypothetical protein